MHVPWWGVMQSMVDWRLKGCSQWRQKRVPATPHQIPPMLITIRWRHIWSIKLHLPPVLTWAQTSHCSVMNALWLIKTRHVCGLRGVLTCCCIHRWTTARALRANRVIILFMHSQREVNAFFMYFAEYSQLHTSLLLLHHYIEYIMIQFPYGDEWSTSWILKTVLLPKAQYHS